MSDNPEHPGGYSRAHRGDSIEVDLPMVRISLRQKGNRMLRTRLGTLLVTASIALVPAIAVTAPAAAAGVSHQVASVSEGSSVVVPMTWYFFGYYRDLRACKEEGNQLMDQGFITNYSCQYRNGRYELYVQYE
jgi:hypothetical protein